VWTIVGEGEFPLLVKIGIMPLKTMIRNRKENTRSCSFFKT